MLLLPIKMHNKVRVSFVFIFQARSAIQNYNGFKFGQRTIRVMHNMN